MMVTSTCKNKDNATQKGDNVINKKTIKEMQCNQHT